MNEKMLSYYIDSVFEQREKIEDMTLRAQEHAKLTHNAEQNSVGVLKIYNSMINRGEVIA